MTDELPPIEHKRIFKVMLFTRDDPETQGAILTGEAIEHEGKLWLVPLWQDAKDEAWSKPRRLVCLSELPAALHLQETPDFEGADYLLNFPIPIADFQRDAPLETDHGFVVLERPALRIARPH